MKDNFFEESEFASDKTIEEVADEPIEDGVLKPKKEKVNKPKPVEITVSAVTRTKILGATKEGNGHAVFRTSKNKDVKVGDKITIK